jgi:hypothetical protein
VELVPFHAITAADVERATDGTLLYRVEFHLV